MTTNTPSTKTDNLYISRWFGFSRTTALKRVIGILLSFLHFFFFFYVSGVPLLESWLVALTVSGWPITRELGVPRWILIWRERIVLCLAHQNDFIQSRNLQSSSHTLKTTNLISTLTICKILDFGPSTYLGGGHEPGTESRLKGEASVKCKFPL